MWQLQIIKVAVCFWKRLQSRYFAFLLQFDSVDTLLIIIVDYICTNEGSHLVANSNGRKFLYNSKGLVVISLLVIYYVPLAHFNKVIKLLNFKSAVNLQCF